MYIKYLLIRILYFYESNEKTLIEHFKYYKEHDFNYLFSTNFPRIYEMYLKIDYKDDKIQHDISFKKYLYTDILISLKYGYDEIQNINYREEIYLVNEETIKEQITEKFTEKNKEIIREIHDIEDKIEEEIDEINEDTKEMKQKFKQEIKKILSFLYKPDFNINIFKIRYILLNLLYRYKKIINQRDIDFLQDNNYKTLEKILNDFFDTFMRIDILYLQNFEKNIYIDILLFPTNNHDKRKDLNKLDIVLLKYEFLKRFKTYGGLFKQKKTIKIIRKY